MPRQRNRKSVASYHPHRRRRSGGHGRPDLHQHPDVAGRPRRPLVVGLTRGKTAPTPPAPSSSSSAGRRRCHGRRGVVGAAQSTGGHVPAGSSSAAASAAYARRPPFTVDALSTIHATIWQSSSGGRRRCGRGRRRCVDPI
uniref:Uncharacterized protein n=1 Tax=Oryza glumipatula TaxID=40148 RepID=A0A0D9Y9L4_9ORYZ